MKKMKFSIQIVSSVAFLFLFMMLSTNSKAQTDLNSIDPYAKAQKVIQKGNGGHVNKLEHRNVDCTNCPVHHGVIHINDSGLNFLTSSQAKQNLNLVIAKTQNDLERYQGKVHDILAFQIQLFSSIIEGISSGMSVRDAAIANYNEYKEKFSPLNGLSQKVEAKLIQAVTF